MANCVKYRFSINLQLFSVVLKSAPLKYITTYCPWDSHQMHSSCTSMSLCWQNNPILWLSWAVSIPKWVSILWHSACAPTDAKLLEGGVLHTWIASKTYTYQLRHWPCGIDSSHKSHNTSHRYPTMHHFVTEMCTYVHISITKCSIVRYRLAHLGIIATPGSHFVKMVYL